MRTNEPNGPETRPSPSAYGGRYNDPYGTYGQAQDDEIDLSLRSVLRFLRRRKAIILSVLMIGVAITAVFALVRTPTYTAEALLLIEGDRRIVDLGSSVTSGQSNASQDRYQVETEINLLKSKDLLTRLVERRYGAEIEAVREDPTILTAIAEPGWLDVAIDSLGDWLRESEWLALDVAVAGDSGAVEMADEGGDPTANWQSLAINMLPQSWLERLNEDQDDLELLTPDEAAQKVLAHRLGEIDENLSVTRMRDSYVISVRYSSENPREAARWANEIANLYIEDQLEQKVALTAGANDYLERRLIELEDELRRAELTVDEFIRNNDAVNPASLGVGGQEVANLTNMLVDARATRKEREARLRFISELRGEGESLDSLTEVLQSPFVMALWQEDSELRRQEAELRALYNDEYPTLASIIDERADIRQRVEAEVDRVVANLRNELQVAQQREASIQADIDAIVAETGSAGQSEIELRRLSREADATRGIYENFLQRYKETREQQELIEANARVIATADPPISPSSGSPERIMLLGTTLSLAFGLGLAFVREKLDDGVRSGKEIEAVVGLPYLGLTPHLSASQRKGKKVHEHMLAKPMSAYTETIRQLYTVLRLSNIDDPPKVVQVTSAVPQEGKTTISVSMAVALAMDGKKVILVDGDLRHPSVQREISMKYERCLIDYLAGDCTLAEATVEHKQLGLDILPVHRLAPNPARLLASGRMQELLSRLRETYDYVIVDGPPVLGMSDSKVLMEWADTVLFVARWEKTTMDTVVDAVAELKGCNADIVGVVVTQVDLSKQKLYGYGGIDAHYGKYYQYYRN